MSTPPPFPPPFPFHPPLLKPRSPSAPFAHGVGFFIPIPLPFSRVPFSCPACFRIVTSVYIFACHSHYFLEQRYSPLASQHSLLFPHPSPTPFPSLPFPSLLLVVLLHPCVLPSRECYTIAYCFDYTPAPTHTHTHTHTHTLGYIPLYYTPHPTSSLWLSSAHKCCVGGWFVFSFFSFFLFFPFHSPPFNDSLCLPFLLFIPQYRKKNDNKNLPPSPLLFFPFHDIKSQHPSFPPFPLSCA